MNIPAVEYRRVVNLLVHEEDEERRLAGSPTLFSRLGRILDARPREILRLNKRQRSSSSALPLALYLVRFMDVECHAHTLTLR